MKINESQLKNIVRNAVLNEAKVLRDNFDEVAKWLTFDNPDQFYFVSIMRRKKDNKGNFDPKFPIPSPNYGGGAWYIKQYRIYSVQDLYKYRDEIINLCNKYNARACITINPRSKSYFDNEIQHMNATQPGRNWDCVLPSRTSRFNRTAKGQRAMVDIDIKDVGKFYAALGICYKMNIPIVNYTTTPSGGYHIIVCIDDDTKFPSFDHEMRNLNFGRKYGKLAKIGVDRDCFDVLYSYVDTPGY